MEKARKTAWVNLVVGLLFLFTALRDKWAPGFLSISGPNHAHVWMNAACAAIFLGSGCWNFMRMHRSATR